MSGNVKLVTPSSGSVTLSAADTASNLTATIPAATDTLVNLASSQSLSNKTITAANSNSVEATSGPTSTQLAGQRNKIINGAMMIDQRNAGAAVTNIQGQNYLVDRWAFFGTQASKLTAQQVADAPVGFVNSLKITSTSAYSVASSDTFPIFQRIEGFNTADMAWGSANAKTVTLSFYVKSSLTGLFGGFFSNSAYNRSFPFSFTISSANTWTPITITIPGDVTGTWATDSSAGINIHWSMGVGVNNVGTAGSWVAGEKGGVSGQVNLVGTNGATFYITGVQLEKGATATPFENRLYGTELALCQRYLPSMSMGASGDLCSGLALSGGTSALVTFPFLVTPRVAPTGVSVSGTLKCRLPSGASTSSATLVQFDNANFVSGSLVLSGMSGLTAGNSAPGGTNTTATVLFTGCEL